MQSHCPSESCSTAGSPAPSERHLHASATFLVSSTLPFPRQLVSFYTCTQNSRWTSFPDQPGLCVSWSCKEHHPLCEKHRSCTLSPVGQQQLLWIRSPCYDGMMAGPQCTSQTLGPQASPKSSWLAWPAPHESPHPCCPPQHPLPWGEGWFCLDLRKTPPQQILCISMLDPALVLHQCWSQPRHQLGHIQLLSRLSEEGHNVIQLLVDFGVLVLQVPLLQQQTQHLLRTCCLDYPQEQGCTAGWPASCPPEISSTRITSRALSTTLGSLRV